MAFKKQTNVTLSVTTPESMLHDIRTKKIEGPLARQADVWREYTDKALEKPDVAIRLPTGSGKTLVGIVLAEWRRRKFQDRVVYLCPTNQLVHQVVKQARDIYGIEVAEFTGAKQDYSFESKNSYRRIEKIAITSYSALFNTNPFFENPDVIILDDAHSCENYISSMFSLLIDRKNNSSTYNALVTLLDGHKDTPNLTRAQRELDLQSLSWLEKIPTTTFYKLKDQIINLLDIETTDNSLYYPWSLLRDHIQACHCYISATQILIRPIIPPTHTHVPFSNAKQRIYMSATLGNGGDLERITGRANIYRLTPESQTDEQGIGRRFFIFPEVSHDETKTEDLIEKSLSIFGRALFITPSDRATEDRKQKIQKLGKYTLFGAKEIEASKEDFTSCTFAAAVIANRYDGMDFPHDECRLLVLEGLPKSANLQEKFLMSKMGCGVLLNDRIQTRIVQAVGRCTRANSDYAAVVVKGNEWLDYLLTKDNTQYLHPEIQAEIDFGEFQSSAEISDIVENLLAFRSQNDDWVEANDSIVQNRSSKTRKIPLEMAELEKSVAFEIKYLNHLWRADYLSAFDECRNILGVIKHPNLKGYRALWNYLAGSCLSMAFEAKQISEDTSKDYYAEAMKATMAILWLVDLAKSAGVELSQFNTQDPYLPKTVERLENHLLSFGVKNNSRFNRKHSEIISALASSEAQKFEQGQFELGLMLGCEAGNTELRAAPDPWWLLSNDLCIVFEDHTNATNDVLSVEKARQVFCHDNWIRENVGGVHEGTEIIKVLITPVNYVSPGGVEHLKDVFILKPDAFRDWAARALGTIIEIRKSLRQEGDLDWRAQTMATLEAQQLTPLSIRDFFKTRKAQSELKEQ
ncbi:DEAD/DEAH box helicase [Pseudomonas sp. MPR-ANC1]|uniref:DEAD/DEAH box helicase n=1 Tax=Pseudomonas sp. MPR-ANC1 TaxID=2075548 RepID=UPI000CD02BDD|nr:DEAD/DEAH box helicase [Pseudomonas sp. MPR-ANC1]POA47913.1 DEAD/DEAH box helicase [Pseudomonas sp. MPR-ANC1]